MSGGIGAGIGEDAALQLVAMGKGIFDAQPPAPAMAEEMHLALAQRLAHRLDLADIALQRPEAGSSGRPRRRCRAGHGTTPGSLEGPGYGEPPATAGSACSGRRDAEEGLRIGLAIDIGDDPAALHGDARHAVRRRPRHREVGGIDRLTIVTPPAAPRSGGASPQPFAYQLVGHGPDAGAQYLDGLVDLRLGDGERRRQHGVWPRGAPAGRAAWCGG